MKQKVVIKVSFNGENKSRTKVMQAAVAVPGVESIAFEGEESDQIVVIGDGLDSVNLTSILRKKVKFAQLLSVSSVEEKKKEEKVTELELGVQSMVWPTYQTGVPQYYFHTVVPNDHYQNGACSIM